MPFSLYIIRHGEPANLRDEFEGPNPPLSSVGRKQAAKAAEQLAQFGGLDYLYSSSLQRAIETAEPIHSQLSVPWHVWPAFCETGRGSWPKLRELQKTGTGDLPALGIDPDYDRAKEYPLEHYPPLSKLKELYPQIETSQPFAWPDEWWLPLRNETREVAYARATQAIEALKKRHLHEKANVGVACHGAFGSVMVTLLMDSPPCDHNRFGHMHAGISKIDIFDDGTTILRFGDYFGHLVPDLITHG